MGKKKVWIRKAISIALILCLMFSSAFSEEENKSIFDQIGDWFGQAWTDSSNWVSQAWTDSSNWVSQAWKDSAEWISGNWSYFTIWVRTITWDNPYSWIRDMVLDEGILAYDSFVGIRDFMSGRPDSSAIKEKLYDELSEQSLLNEEKDILWDMFNKWAEEHHVTTEQVALLTIPCVERLNILGEEALGLNIEISGPAIAQYLLTILEAMKIYNHEDAEARINALRNSLESLTRPIVIGEQDQNIAITEDHCYIENFTYSNGKYQIIMLVTPADKEKSVPPLMRGKTTDQIIDQYFGDTELLGEVDETKINGSLASQARRFNTELSGVPVSNAILQVWSKENDYLFFMITDREWNDKEFKDWRSSVALSAEGKVSFEADFSSDGAFYGISQGLQKYTINRYFTEAKFTVPKTGHGWAAERGNNLIDNIKGVIEGKHSILKGDDNVKNGADRVVEKKINGEWKVIEQIQTKYYSTAARTVNACFNESGYRYVDADGMPMTLEVPSDQYETAVKLMEKRIQNGEVRNVDPTDAEMAKKIVRKGALSYQQAKHLAKAGTIESLLYDSYHACVYATSAMGISAAVEFAISLWSGESMDTAIRNSIECGLRTGGITFIVSVLSSQLLKTGLNSALVPASNAIVHAMGPKVTQAVINAFRPAGSAIYGAAAQKAAAKLLRGNIVTAALTFVILSAFDVAEIIQGRISWKQLGKNAINTAAGIMGGVVGYAGGAALVGTSLFPGAGTIVGLIVGAAMGWGASEGTKALTNLIAEDDGEEMIKIINEQFALIAEEYFLTEEEVNRSIENLQRILSQNILKEMYQYGNHEAFARQLIELSIDPVVMERQYISLPSEEKYTEVLTEALNDIYAEIGDAPEVE